MISETTGSRRCSRILEIVIPAAGYVAGICAITASCLASHEAAATVRHGQEIAYKIGACVLGQDFGCDRLKAYLEATNQIAQDILKASHLSAVLGGTILTGLTLYYCLRPRSVRVINL